MILFGTLPAASENCILASKFAPSLWNKWLSPSSEHDVLHLDTGNVFLVEGYIQRI